MSHHEIIVLPYNPSFGVRLNRFHGSAHTTIKRNSMGIIVMMAAPRCVNPKCELNVGHNDPNKEKHFA
mgnify:CR=1 FL=1